MDVDDEGVSCLVDKICGFEGVGLGVGFGVEAKLGDGDCRLNCGWDTDKRLLSCCCTKECSVEGVASAVEVVVVYVETFNPCLLFAFDFRSLSAIFLTFSCAADLLEP